MPNPQITIGQRKKFDRKAWDQKQKHKHHTDPVFRAHTLAKKREAERARLLRPGMKAKKAETGKKYRLRKMAENPRWGSEKVKKAYIRVKAQLLTLLGDRCNKCGITDPRVLQFHHINGDGQLDRKGPMGVAYLRRLIKRASSIPPSIETLCANCHVLTELAES